MESQQCGVYFSRRDVERGAERMCDKVVAYHIEWQRWLLFDRFLGECCADSAQGCHGVSVGTLDAVGTLLGCLFMR